MALLWQRGAGIIETRKETRKIRELLQPWNGYEIPLREMEMVLWWAGSRTPVRVFD